MPLPPSLWTNLHRLEPLKRHPQGTLILTDVDGTISNIADDHEQAIVDPAMCRTLEMLAESGREVVLISGRRSRDVREMIGSDRIVYVGNHGFETLRNGRFTEPPGAAGYRRAVRAAIGDVQGAVAELGEPIRLDDKDTALAIHFRGCRDPEAVGRRLVELLEPVAKSRGLMLAPGRMVLELRPRRISKGTAAGVLIREMKPTKILCLGDDYTDADAFAAVQQAPGDDNVCVAVMSDEAPSRLLEAADFHVDSVNDVRRLFQWLART